MSLALTPASDVLQGTYFVLCFAMNMLGSMKVTKEFSNFLMQTDAATQMFMHFTKMK